MRLTVNELARVLIATLGPGVSGLSHDEGFARLVVVDDQVVPAHEVRSRVRDFLARHGQDGVGGLPVPSAAAIETAAALYEAPTWAWKIQ
ncbi:hypothetical protein [Pseudonocardia alni]|uniref:hypothetical protein n=1 Tax=Pseudonocardia alni TaxID=33907 RepID=UPI00279F4C1F|nr:hypothetical protein PaSha_12620 [Pseudonocardia alni]